MVKIDALAGQDSPLAEGITRAGALGHLESKRDSEQSVSISEEGKKKHILGQLMSRFLHVDKAKGHLDR